MKTTQLEEIDGYLKRATITEGDTVDKNSNTYKFKEGMAETGLAFVNGFVRMLVPAVVIGFLFILLFFYMMCK